MRNYVYVLFDRFDNFLGVFDSFDNLMDYKKFLIVNKKYDLEYFNYAKIKLNSYYYSKNLCNKLGVK